MKKIFISVFLTVVFMVCLFLAVAGFAIGNYCVEFGLLRDGINPPKALSLVMPPNTWEFNKPDADSEVWQIRSFDGLNLVATHFLPKRGKNADKWAVIIHGYGCNQKNSWYIAEEYLKNGYNVLTPDLRASGLSEGSYITLGVKESRDVVDWAREIAKRDEKAKIVLHGVSMGAATAMIAAASQDLPNNVCAVVEESGFSSAYDLLSVKLEESFNIPAYPVMPVVDYRCAKLAGFSLREASPKEALKYVYVPTLFIHGDSDALVPPYMSDILYSALKSERKELYIAKDALHGIASQSNHDEYYRRVFEFLRRYT